MIHLLNEHRTKIGSFQTDDELFNYVIAIENLKLLEDHPQFGQTQWSFVVFSPKWVFDLYRQTKKELLAPPVRAAYEQQIGLIEICTGDFLNPKKIPMTSGLDLKTLKKTWCFEYCRVHGFSIDAEDSTNVSPDITKAGAKGEGGL